MNMISANYLLLTRLLYHIKNCECYVLLLNLHPFAFLICFEMCTAADLFNNEFLSAILVVSDANITGSFCVVPVTL